MARRSVPGSRRSIKRGDWPDVKVGLVVDGPCGEDLSSTTEVGEPDGESDSQLCWIEMGEIRYG